MRVRVTVHGGRLDKPVGSVTGGDGSEPGAQSHILFSEAAV